MLDVVDKAENSSMVIDNLYELLKQAKTAFGDKPAVSIIKGNRQSEKTHRLQSVSYKELFGSVTQAANLFGKSLSKGNSRLALIAPFSLDALTVNLAAQTVAVTTILPINLKTQAYLKAITLFGADALITISPKVESRLWENMEQLIQHSVKINFLLQIDQGEPEERLKGPYKSARRIQDAFFLYGLEGARSAIPGRVSLFKYPRSVKGGPRSRLNFTYQASPQSALRWFMLSQKKRGVEQTQLNELKILNDLSQVATHTNYVDGEAVFFKFPFSRPEYSSLLNYYITCGFNNIFVENIAQLNSVLSNNSGSTFVDRILIVDECFLDIYLHSNHIFNIFIKVNNIIIFSSRYPSKYIERLSHIWPDMMCRALLLSSFHYDNLYIFSRI